MKPARCDIAIVGAGMAGSSLALLLSKAIPAAHIVLLETFSLTGQANTLPSYDDRSSALSLGSSRIYQQLGIWPDLQACATAIHQVHVSDRGHPGGTLLSAENMPGIEKELGYVIENRSLGAVLLSAVKHANNISVNDRCTVEHISLKAQSVSLQIRNENTDTPSAHSNPWFLSCDLLIIADGSESPLREQLGIAAEKIPYQQSAIIANVSSSAHHQHIAYERFTDSGPMALLPLADYQGEHRSARVWTVETQDAPRLMGLSDEDFLQQLQQRFGQRLGFFTKVGRRAVYPLSLHKAQEQVRQRIVLMGNAAHSMHPVAGQGFNLSLRDCQCLANTLAQAAIAHEDPGSLPVLQSYLDQQLGDQQSTIGASHLLTLLFSTEQTLPALLRNSGLLGLNFLPGLKQWFTRQAMGLGGRRG